LCVNIFHRQDLRLIWTEPETSISFPTFLAHNETTKTLVGIGLRRISFLKVGVYVIGLYMSESDVKSLKNVDSWKAYDKNAFIREETLVNELLSQPVDITVRIEPIRTTNGAHLRDGFTRSLLQRMRDQSKDLSEDDEREILVAIKDFKSRFPHSVVKPGSAFLFTKLRDGRLKMEFEGEDLGVINSKWLAVNFLMTYLTSDKPVSPAAKESFASGFKAMLQ